MLSHPTSLSVINPPQPPAHPTPEGAASGSSPVRKAPARRIPRPEDSIVCYLGPQEHGVAPEATAVVEGDVAPPHPILHVHRHEREVDVASHAAPSDPRQRVREWPPARVDKRSRDHPRQGLQVHATQLQSYRMGRVNRHGRRQGLVTRLHTVSWRVAANVAGAAVARTSETATRDAMAWNNTVAKGYR